MMALALSGSGGELGRASALLRAIARSAEQLVLAQLQPSAGAMAWPPAPAHQHQQQRSATKKAGGNAKQAVGSQPKHLGVKMTDGELAFPGMIIARQRGTRFRAGANAAMGRDHTIFATSAGFVRFSRTMMPFGKERRFISLDPVNGDATSEYKRTVDEMVQRRAEIKRGLLDGSTPLEPALHFQLPSRDGKLSWVGQESSPAQAPQSPGAASSASPDGGPAAQPRRPGGGGASAPLVGRQAKPAAKQQVQSS